MRRRFPSNRAALGCVTAGALWVIASALGVLPILSVGQGGAMARDLGNFGEVFPIAEPDLLALIKGRISAMIADGGMERLTAEMQGKARSYANRPKGQSLPRATESRRYALDLSIRVDHDLADQNGVVFAAAGTVVNPLAWSGFQKDILFIDGDDPDQVAWAVNQGDEITSLIVLTQGAPLDLGKTRGRRFWFDQSGIMAARFQIAHLPAKVTRADPVMEVEEVVLPQGYAGTQGRADDQGSIAGTSQDQSAGSLLSTSEAAAP